MKTQRNTPIGLRASRARGTVLRVAAAGLVSFLCVLPARAGTAALGMAGARSLLTRGVEAASLNPALLAWDRDLSLRLVSTSAQAYNTGFTVGDYNRWNGKTWSEGDKEQILDAIPESGLDAQLGVQTEGPGMAWRGWAVTTEGYAAGSSRLPKEFARLLLFGNDPRESFRLDGTDGEGIAWSMVRLSHGRELPPVDWTPWGEGPMRVSAGASLKILQGWGYTEVTDAIGGLSTSSDGLTGQALFTGRSSRGGVGAGLDLGLAALLPGDFRAGLFCRNLISVLRWGRESKRWSELAYADTVTAENLDDDEDLVTEESSHVPIPAFTRSLPSSLRLSVARRYTHAAVELDLEEGLSTRPGTSTTPRLALGASYAPFSWVEGRVGLAFGGADRGMASAGIGFSASRVRLDLALAGMGSANPFDPRGVGAGLSLGF